MMHRVFAVFSTAAWAIGVTVALPRELYGNAVSSRERQDVELSSPRPGTESNLGTATMIECWKLKGR